MLFPAATTPATPFPNSIRQDVCDVCVCVCRDKSQCDMGLSEVGGLASWQSSPHPPHYQQNQVMGVVPREGKIDASPPGWLCS